MLRAWFGMLVALLAGAGLVGAVQGLVVPNSSPVRYLMAACIASNWAAAGAVGVALLPLAAVAGLRRFLPAPATAFWLGWAVGLAPLASHYLPGVAGAAVPALLFAAAAPYLGRVLAPGRLVWPALALLVAVLAWGAFVRPEVPTIEEFLALPPWTGPEEEPEQAPDLVLISIDTLRADAITGDRPPGYELETFDKLRTGGLWTKYALSSSNQTLPGHLGMLTGLDAMDHGVRGNRDFVPPGVRLLPETLKEHGFRTAAVISNRVLRADTGMSRGFEVYDDSCARTSPIDAIGPTLELHTWLGWALPEQYAMVGLSLSLFRLVQVKPPAMDELKQAGGRARGRVTTDHAHRVLDQLLEQDRPYFLFLHYLDPHHPYGAPEEFDGRVAGEPPPLPERYLPDKPGQQIKDLPIANVAKDLVGDDAEAREAAREATRYYQRVYLENVAYTDALIGEVLERLEESGRPFVLCVTSDHGEHFGEHGLMLHANSLYEELLRVPFFLYGPDVNVPWNTEIPDEIHLRDVVPTLLYYAGVDFDDPNWFPAIKGWGERPHISTDDKRVAARWGEWKWIARRGDDGEPVVTEIYHLATDPFEEKNLLGQREIPAEMRAWIDQALARDRFEDRISDLSEAEKRAVDVQLDDVGYVDGPMADDWDPKAAQPGSKKR